MVNVPDYDETPKTSFTLFCDTKRLQIKEQLSTEEYLKVFVSLWENTNPEEKAVFKKEAARLKAAQKKFYGHITRPVKAFDIWSAGKRTQISGQDPTASVRVIKRRMEIIWKNMSGKEKLPFYAEEESQKADFKAAIAAVKNEFKNNKEIPKAKRPRNAYMIYYNIKKDELSQDNTSIESGTMNEEIRRIWKNMSNSEKSPFQLEANRLKTEYDKKYPDFKYQPWLKRQQNLNEETVEEQIEYSPEDNVLEDAISLSTEADSERSDTQSSSTSPTYSLECSFSNLGLDDDELEHLENIEPTIKVQNDFPWLEVFRSII
ncbi:hypothetical protein GCK72_022954 [Caenorhabditis remanei]|uniref:Sex-determining region Y protein n=1 Tax=Caenorhabditis remanei TaxID=31234 RepID=A0A6A5FV57_CAERE|nr:hypothetical protein GCK72_022954 [Caenorhabditis remanei]KAF1746498.1 hypothetical protein GCK72_022954 [Caenorhabditis remanei]